MRPRVTRWLFRIGLIFVRILVTGGAGFIGSHIVEAALAAGHEVAVVDNLSTGKRENVASATRFYRVELRDGEAVRRVIRDFRPTVVSHQAAQASVALSVREPRFDVEVNLIGGLQLLDACVANGVERVVFASTGGALYGEVGEDCRANENTPPAPVSPYAISKLAFEQLLGVYRAHRGLESTILRYGNVYGPRQDPDGEAGVVAIFFKLIGQGRALPVNARRIVGDGGCVRDYVYVADVARANLMAATRRLQQRVLNVGTGVATSTVELARGIAMAVGDDNPRLDRKPRRMSDLERSVLDPVACSQALGELVSLNEGLRRTYAWLEVRRIASGVAKSMTLRQRDYASS
jgi:UDP-glucose 4-epimerase